MRPTHALFPEQEIRNQSLVSTLSAEIVQSVSLAQKAGELVKKYQETYEIVERTGEVIGGLKEPLVFGAS